MQKDTYVSLGDAMVEERLACEWVGADCFLFVKECGQLCFPVLSFARTANVAHFLPQLDHPLRKIRKVHFSFLLSDEFGESKLHLTCLTGRLVWTGRRLGTRG